MYVDTKRDLPQRLQMASCSIAEMGTVPEIFYGRGFLNQS